MVWDRKQKDLTPEEAIALAKTDREPFWFGSPPLFVGVNAEGKSTLHPLHPDFTKKSWLVTLIDPTSLDGIFAMQYVLEWNRRFQGFDLNTIVVLRTVYEPWLQKRAVDRFLEIYKIKFPLVLDSDQAIAAAFNTKKYPQFIFVDHGKISLSTEGENWFSEVELKLHKLLRKDDPGLPLSPVFKSENSFKPTGSLELGQGRGANLVQRPHFEEKKEEEAWLEKLSSKSVILTGEWKQEKECITTSDPKATFSIRCAHPSLFLLAQTVAKGGEMCKVLVEMDGQPVIDVFAGASLHYDERGQSHLTVRTLQMRHVVSNLTAKQKEITFHFPFAKQTPAALYGLRFSK